MFPSFKTLKNFVIFPDAIRDTLHTTALPPHVMATIDNRVTEGPKTKKGNGAHSQNHQHDSKVPKYCDVEHGNYKNKKGNINIQFSSKIKMPYGSPSQRNCKPEKKGAEECNIIDDTFKEQKQGEDINRGKVKTLHMTHLKLVMKHQRRLAVFALVAKLTISCAVIVSSLRSLIMILQMKQFLSHLQTDTGKEEIKNSYVRTAIKNEKWTHCYCS